MFCPECGRKPPKKTLVRYRLQGRQSVGRERTVKADALPPSAKALRAGAGAPEKSYDLIILGKGAEGISAARHASRGGLKTLLYHGQAGQQKDLNVISGAEIVSDDCYIKRRVPGGFEVMCGERVCFARRLLVCAGIELPTVRFKGAESDVYGSELFLQPYTPKTLAIVGGDAVGLHYAAHFNNAGSAVTVYESTDKIAGSFEREISEEIQRIFEKRGIVFRLGATLAETARPHAEAVIVCAGRKPLTGGLGLENIGVFTRNGAIVTDSRMKTNVPGVFAIGSDGDMLKTDRREAEVAVGAMLGHKQIMDYGDRTHSVLDIEAACIGETLDSARAKGFAARETRVPIKPPLNAYTRKEEGCGICKLVWSEKPRSARARLLGAHILGRGAAEIMPGLSEIIHREICAGQLKNAEFPHRYRAAEEIIMEAVSHA
ncbi:MAG: FAD-dependent oxidoreductase [Oscillospiraceae bacterium]|jgi:pyruvate/2-oxoglutarate dehydrogenase complex dihydrolipoamide dehydrogenase (E3) component|nr:FAD-dependent oxidoreductase [Oscillospiraceae bacterium]